MQASGASNQKPSAPAIDPNAPAPSSSSTTAGAFGNDQKSAALRGATLAFNRQKTTDSDKPKPGPKPKPALRTPNPTVTTTAATAPVLDNGALRAATTAQASREHGLAGAGARPRSPLTVVARAYNGSGSIRPGPSRETIGGNADEMGHSGRELEHGVGAHRPSQLDSPSAVSASTGPYGSHLLHPANANGSNKSLSPGSKPASLIAATLAATRSASPSLKQQRTAPNHLATSAPAQAHSRVIKRPDSDTNSLNSTPASPELLDMGSIPSTSTLVSVFETNEGGNVDRSRKTNMPEIGSGSGTGLRPRPKPRLMTPPRSPSPSPQTSSEIMRKNDLERPAPARAAKPEPPSQIRYERTFSAVPTNASEALSPSRGGQGNAASQTVGRAPAPAPAPALTPKTTRLKPLAGDPPGTPPRESRRAQPITSPEVPRSPSPRKPMPPTPTSRASRERTPKSPPIVRRVATELVSPQPKRIITPITLQPALADPTLITGAKNKTPEQTSSETSSSAIAAAANKPPLIGETTERASSRLSDTSSSSNDTFVSASSIQSPEPVQSASPSRASARPALGSRQQSAKSSPVRRTPQRGTSEGSSSTAPSVTKAPHPSVARPSRGQPALLSPNSNLGLDSLANAIMAGNIASSRNSPNVSSRTSPAPAPPVPPPRRHGTGASTNTGPLLRASHTGGDNTSSIHHHHHQRSPNFAVTRPGGTMLATLRLPPPTTSLSDDEDSRRRRQRHLHKGGKKHAHHEGSRRRWRDEVTPRERRRYEAVWASNRGLFLRPGFAFQHPDHWQQQQQQQQPLSGPHAGDGGATTTLTQTDLSRAWEGPAADLVANVVARDIWSRSRLPADELAEVWDLVDRAGGGALGKTEFVVGMWLIDQRLRGRKIPARVSESVWESARGGARVNIHVGGGSSGGGGGGGGGGRRGK